MSLTLPEEVVLLTLDGEGRPLGRQGLAAALALGAALMAELALAGRIDTDRHALHRLHEAPTGDPAQDAALPLLREAPDSRGALMLLAREEARLRPLVVGALAGKGVLREEAGRALLLIPVRRWVPATGRPEPAEALARLHRALEGDHVPDPREALLVALLRAAGLLPLLLPEALLGERQARLELLTRLEALGRSLGEAVAALRAARLGGG